LGDRAGTKPEPADLSDRWTYAVLGLLVVYVFVRSIVAAAGKPFWYDELLTEIVAGLGSWHRIMEALRLPADGQPPLFYVIENFASKLCGKQEIALRLPSAAGMVCAAGCVFAFARRQRGNLVGLIATAGLLLTVVFESYALESRPYSMVFALIAFAAVCYQRARSPLWIAVLAVSLILAESLHYLAVLAILPFAVAEGFETWKERRVRWGVWAAIAAGALPAVLSLKLLQLNKAYYGAHHYYSHFSVSSIPGMYAELLGVPTHIGGAVGLAVIAAILAALFSAGGDREKNVREGLLLMSFAALPFFGLLFTKAAHSAMTSRYVLSTVLGLVLGAAFCLPRTGARKALLVAGVFVATGVGVSELRFWRYERGDRQMVSNRGADTLALFSRAGHADLPVVVPNGGTLLGVVHYAFRDSPQRFVYLQSDGTEQDAEKLDTAEKGLLQIQRYVGIRVRPKREFFAANEQFLVYTEGNNVGKDDITIEELKEGREVELVADDGIRALYLVGGKKKL
jgi:hypothetical protein